MAEGGSAMKKILHGYMLLLLATGIILHTTRSSAVSDKENALSLT